ncbi:tRNA (guanosine(37)-N1)-methyltransferase TrmD [Parvibacter caecicola]|uniref:tRNA (guanine-N(1)-)-methyltransferase n=1 Tax=Parvibacter caecicola TaxID=747645 RepID=A0A7W5D042_9ACTN|nr:tRNA (guanosine(37)-N1)-methyltransferase TrmD [Parvibacter caecicola]MBB3170434.1 tRNA (guanine37-N1)-methyltransferase [Parvibacter caecicola]MCR2041601.1 tRNA (guanosine(37)-N1)-methyltransferase TrmD [Parvibacter caecicola]RNL12169.1 tRNA (guanosine(37)-N1)-methyltransferase TrmD [Parvibacter caecicola]
MIIETLSTFPEMYHSVMGASMMKRAQDKGIISFTAYDLRDWTYDRHRTTDDDPYGGGAGLVMKCQPIFEAVEDLSGKSAHYWEDEPACPRTGPAPRHADGPAPTVVFLAPQGQRFDDQLANRLAKSKRLLFVCGHYEGIDERAYALADEVISLGDYVLTSGELASMVVIDAVVRKIPGVLGAEGGADDESFADGLLEYPQYTRPAQFRGMEVPAPLTSGNHALVAQWRRQQSLERTARFRPDLLEAAPLSDSDRAFLKTLNENGRDKGKALS